MGAHRINAGALRSLGTLIGTLPAPNREPAGATA
jgi:hypothetical protein